MTDPQLPELARLIRQLKLLQSHMLELEASALGDYRHVHPVHRASARNLMHYLALRRHDIRKLQSELATLGLSSLGRTEPHVMSALTAVLTSLARLSGSKEVFAQSEPGIPKIGEGALLLDKKTDALFGPPPAGRNVRIMVTVPSEAATDYELVRNLLVGGMDCMRINCAHDSPEAWSAMIANLRRAEKENDKHCKILMDIAGPKLRTRPIEPGPAVLKYRPQRDAFGRVVSPARIWLTSNSNPQAAPEQADAVIPVSPAWLKRVKQKDRIRFTDARGASRALTVTRAVARGRWAESIRTAYIIPGLVLEIRKSARKSGVARVWRTKVGAPPRKNNPSN
jgi:pyruvate kinase